MFEIPRKKRKRKAKGTVEESTENEDYAKKIAKRTDKAKTDKSQAKFTIDKKEIKLRKEENNIRITLDMKHEPLNFSECIGNREVFDQLNEFLRRNEIPNLIFYGNFGLGKTVSAKIILRHFFKRKKQLRSLKNYIHPSFLYVDGGIETSLDIVRDVIIPFCDYRGLSFFPLKIIIIDEFDGLSTKAQKAFKNLMDNSKNNVRFILITNHIDSIYEGIKDRCTKFHFEEVPKEEILEYLLKICKKEKVDVPEEEVKKILWSEDSDYYYGYNYNKTNIRSAILELEKLIVKYKPLPKKIIEEIPKEELDTEIEAENLSEFDAIAEVLGKEEIKTNLMDDLIRFLKFLRMVSKVFGKKKRENLIIDESNTLLMVDKKDEPEEKEEAWVSTLINSIFNELELKKTKEYEFTLIAETEEVKCVDREAFMTQIKKIIQEGSWKKDKANVLQDFIVANTTVEEKGKLKAIKPKKSIKKNKEGLQEYLQRKREEQDSEVSKVDKIDQMRLPKETKKKLKQVRKELAEIDLGEISDIGKSELSNAKIVKLLEKLNKRMANLENILKEDQIETQPKLDLSREEKITLLDDYYYQAVTNPKFMKKKGDFQKFLAKQAESNRNLPSTPISLTLPQIKEYNDLLIKVFDELQIRDLINHWEVAYRKEENTNFVQVGFEFKFLGNVYFFDVLSHLENLKDPHIGLDGTIQGITEKFQSSVDFELAFLGFLHEIFDKLGLENMKDWK